MSDALSNLAPAADAARDEIGNALSTFEERRTELLDALPRVFVTDEDSTGRAADFVSQLKALRQKVEQRRDEIRQPYGDAVQVANNTAGRWLTAVEQAIIKVERMIADYRAEQRQLAQAEQQRQADEERAARIARTGSETAAAPPAPPAAPVKLATTRGDFGSSVSDRAKRVYRVVDVRKVPLLILKSEAVIAAIEKQCAVAGKLMTKIAGVEITDAVGISHRKK